ncbi:GNAT family N-acetyltransferase [Edaphobacillus lindanitolerans]|uniref:N-acetylglutamate synthase, GNAT family n=1 Tax=Edaphobacillus lindanitolerans TaxID=550447 RepID=A0A1U7PRY8_9BACI|nr:GNAT family N-acetyltransferase [Edaphobacillus lindanitolerans]SIT89447.1 N-acetylglutamate synthase, GNAT family [Edaphobacillus lindanitolerans]
MIRLMTPNDINTVRQIAEISRRRSYEEILPAQALESSLNRDYSPQMLMKRMEKTTMLIAEHEGKPVGFANFTRVDEDGDAELTAFHLLPQYAGTGFGDRLIEAGVAGLEGGLRLFAYVEGPISEACTFFEGCGFELVDEFEELFEGYPTLTAQYVHYLKTPALV